MKNKNRTKTYLVPDGGGGGGTVADLFNRWENQSSLITGQPAKDWNSRSTQATSRIDDVRASKPSRKK